MAFFQSDRIRAWFRGKRRESASVQNPPPEPDDALRCSAWVSSDVGKVRGNNEDNYILCTMMNEDSSVHSDASISESRGWQLFGVFDGMGGGEAGELASSGSAKLFREAFAELKKEPDRSLADTLIRRAFQDANNQVVSLQQQYQIFGTTGTVLCFDGTACKLYHLGDSRCYLFRDDNLFQLTKDQTLAQMKIEVGMYDENDPKAEIEKHKLTDFIGRDPTGQNTKPVESLWIPVSKGDSFLLCSDGLYDMCTDEEILQILRSDSAPESHAAALTDKASAQGGIDNTTCLLVRFM